MSYELSFTEEFFTGAEETQVTDRPTSVLEAIENLPVEQKFNIARDVFGEPAEVAAIWIDTESFAHDVLEHVREVNRCSNLDVPVSVWIDSEGYYTVDVYE